MGFDANIREHVWAQKYRPQSLSDVILPDEILNPICRHIADGRIPNMIFVNPLPGIGKSTLANAIINELDAEYIKLNASDDNGISVVRDTIIPFAVRQSVYGNSHKVVWLEEADRMSSAFQDGMRSLMEEYSSAVSFILTANNKNTLSEPFLDRFEQYDFNLESATVKREIIAKIILRFKFILNSENCVVDDNALLMYVDKGYPRIRRLIHDMQKYVTGNGMILDEGILKTVTISSELIDYIMSGNFTKAKEFVLQNSVNPDSLYSNLYRTMLPKVTDPSKYANTLITLNKYQVQHSQCSDKELNAVAGLLELCSILKKGN